MRSSLPWRSDRQERLSDLRERRANGSGGALSLRCARPFRPISAPTAFGSVQARGLSAPGILTKDNAFCGQRAGRGDGRARRDGLLPLRLLPLLVGRTGERLHAVEPESGGGHGRRRDLALRQDAAQPAQRRTEVRRPPDDQSSPDRPRRCLRGNHPDAPFTARRRQLRRDRAAHARRPAQATDFPAELGGSGRPSPE